MPCRDKRNSKKDSRTPGESRMILREKKKKWVKLICKCGHNKLYHYNSNLTKELPCLGICNCKKFKLAGDALCVEDVA